MNELQQTLMEIDSYWTVKGFIDSHHNIYPISNDTKVISKIIELLIFPKILKFAHENDLKIELAPYQNYYPDMTFVDSDGNKYAVDLKSTYRIDKNYVNGMTLGAFSGYFRNRDSNKNILFPYSSYKKHYVLGVMYTRTSSYEMQKFIEKRSLSGTKECFKLLEKYINNPSNELWESISQYESNLNIKDKNVLLSYNNEFDVFNLDNMSNIKSVIKDLQLFVQEKWKIATDKPGSGNTKNIGGEKIIQNLTQGKGIFFKQYGEHGHKYFDLYWQEYETINMARDAGRATPRFKNIATFNEWLSTLKQKF